MMNCSDDTVYISYLKKPNKPSNTSAFDHIFLSIKAWAALESVHRTNASV